MSRGHRKCKIYLQAIQSSLNVQAVAIGQPYLKKTNWASKNCLLEISVKDNNPDRLNPQRGSLHRMSPVSVSSMKILYLFAQL